MDRLNLRWKMFVTLLVLAGLMSVSIVFNLIRGRGTHNFLSSISQKNVPVQMAVNRMIRLSTFLRDSLETYVQTNVAQETNENEILRGLQEIKMWALAVGEGTNSAVFQEYFSKLSFQAEYSAFNFENTNENIKGFAENIVSNVDAALLEWEQLVSLHRQYKDLAGFNNGPTSGGDIATALSRLKSEHDKWWNSLSAYSSDSGGEFVKANSQLARFERWMNSYQGSDSDFMDFLASFKAVYFDLHNNVEKLVTAETRAQKEDLLEKSVSMEDKFSLSFDLFSRYVIVKLKDLEREQELSTNKIIRNIHAIDNQQAAIFSVFNDRILNEQKKLSLSSKTLDDWVLVVSVITLAALFFVGGFFTSVINDFVSSLKDIGHRVEFAEITTKIIDNVTQRTKKGLQQEIQSLQDVSSHIETMDKSLNADRRVLEQTDNLFSNTDIVVKKSKEAFDMIQDTMKNIDGHTKEMNLALKLVCDLQLKLNSLIVRQDELGRPGKVLKEVKPREVVYAAQRLKVAVERALEIYQRTHDEVKQSQLLCQNVGNQFDFLSTNSHKFSDVFTHLLDVQQERKEQMSAIMTSTEGVIQSVRQHVSDHQEEVNALDELSGYVEILQETVGGVAEKAGCLDDIQNSAYSICSGPDRRGRLRDGGVRKDIQDYFNFLMLHDRSQKRRRDDIVEDGVPSESTVLN